MSGNKTVFLSFSALTAALLGLLSQIALPLPSGVPLTFQTFGVALSGFLLGIPSGLCAVGTWLALGAVGLPLFSGFRGGTAVLFGPTGGFLLGFLLLVLFCGIAKHLPFRKGLLWMILGTLLCHLCGIFWFLWMGNTTFSAALLAVSLPYLPKDLLCVGLAFWTARGLRKKIPLLK